MAKKFGGRQEGAGRKNRADIEKLQSIAWIYKLRQIFSAKEGKTVTWVTISRDISQKETKHVPEDRRIYKFQTAVESVTRSLRSYKIGESSPTSSRRRLFPEANATWEHGIMGVPLWEAVKGTLNSQYFENELLCIENVSLLLAHELCQFHTDKRRLPLLDLIAAKSAESLSEYGLTPEKIVEVACSYAGFTDKKKQKELRKKAMPTLSRLNLPAPSPEEAKFRWSAVMMQLEIDIKKSERF